MKLRLAAPLLPLIVLAACDGATEPPPLLPDDPAAEISDGMHGGPEGFYFLPPMVSAPVYHGTFDPALSPVVEICESPACEELHATFSRTERHGSEVVRIDEADEHYLVNWHTNATGTVVGQTYRVRVLVGELMLGYADIQMASNAREARNVTGSGIVGMVHRQTLPVKFRIETGIVGAVVVSPPEATIDWGKSQQFSATVYDLHGMSLGNPVIIWTSSAEDVARVDATGLATAVEVGGTTITARVAPAHGSATLNVTEPPYAGSLDSFAYQHAPGVSGELRSILVQLPDDSSGELTVEIIDGLAILEGDMIIATEEDFDEWAWATDSDDLMARSVITQPGSRWLKPRWPNAVVPFSFQSDWGSAYTNELARSIISDAMDRISAVSSVRFVRRTTEDDWVIFKSGAGCSAHLGRKGGYQTINLRYPSCFQNDGGTVVHEIMHALGFLHEHTRMDRAAWVQINFSNIHSDKWSQYKLNRLSTVVGHYDYGSIMHYPDWGFCREDDSGACIGPTMESRTAVTDFGQRERLSEGDIDGLVSTYGPATRVRINEPTRNQLIVRGVDDLVLRAEAIAALGREIQQYIWTSDINGHLGTSTSPSMILPSVTLHFGRHSITVEAVDAFGFSTSPGAVPIWVEPGVTIVSPANDRFVVHGICHDAGYCGEAEGRIYVDLELSGVAWTAEHGLLTGDALVWTTDRDDLQDPFLGTGETVQVRLWADWWYDEHVVTFTATDPSGVIRTATRKITFLQIG
jgi:hypothetical protein